MSSSTGTWREHVLQHFTEEARAVADLSVVTDPDGILLEPGVVEALSGRGYDLHVLEDHVALRLHLSARREPGEHLVVVSHAREDESTDIPFDLLEEARATERVFSFRLSGLFPGLAPNVVGALQYEGFEDLKRAVQDMEPGELGENATRDFILRHVFDIAPEIIKQPSDLMRVLLRRHYRARVFPHEFDIRLIELLSRFEQWRKWPLDRIIPSRKTFFAFLQERWPHFLLAEGYPLIEGRKPPAPSISGPTEIPFDHDDVRVYIDNLFAEGILEPTPAVSASSVAGTWYRLGVIDEPEEDAHLRLETLLDVLHETLPNANASHSDWLAYATRWAEAVKLRWSILGKADEALDARFSAFHDGLELGFGEWMLERFASIHSLPHLPSPVTLDKIPRFLAHHRNKGAEDKKVALIVVDGMAVDQWLVIREHLRAFEFEEARAFAWVPTLTSVSRQSIFAGEPPYFYPDHLFVTRKEERHWHRFWGDHGLDKQQARFINQKKQEDDQRYVERIKEVVDHPRCAVVGIIFGTLDQMLHGTVTGTGGLHAQVRQWAQQGALDDVLRHLVGKGFDVFITADHGNIEASGGGKPNVGAIADERGERVHIFKNELGRENAHRDHPDTIEWPSIGLPPGFLPLMTKGRRAFVHEGKRLVSHGGLSLEEVIVPFVQIKEDV